MNFEQFTKEYRDRTRVPAKATVEQSRFMGVVNSALRHIWSDLPAEFVRGEVEVWLEPPRAITIGFTDPNLRVLEILTSIPSSETDWLGLTIEFRVDSVLYRRLIIGAKKIGPRYWVTLDEPRPSGTTNIPEGKVFTRDYPLPPRVGAILGAYTRDGDLTEPLEFTPVPLSGFADDLGSIQEGDPTMYSMGDFQVMEALHYTPEAVALPALLPLLKWGFDNTGVEHGFGGATPFYGPAGEFCYIEVPVLGRVKWGRVLPNGEYYPRYIGPHSPPSNYVTTTWGAEQPIIYSPNISWLMGPAADNDNSACGIEKWVFRARRATESVAAAGNHARYKREVSDDIPRLWAIVDGDSESYRDGGQFDPVQRVFLSDLLGQRVVRFDTLPSDVYPVVFDVIYRPPQVQHPNDALGLPSEVLDAFFWLVVAFDRGTGDGEVDRESSAFKHYVMSVGRAFTAQRRALTVAMGGIDGADIGVEPKRVRIK